MSSQPVANNLSVPDVGFRFVSDARGVQVVLTDAQGQAVNQFPVVPVLDFSGGRLDVRA